MAEDINSQDRTASKTPLSGESPPSSDSCLGKTVKLDNGNSLQDLKKIGKGGFAAVYLAREICKETNEVVKIVALKIPSEVDGKAALQREFDAHNDLKVQSHIVIPPISHLKHAELPCLEYEYAQHGDLRQYLNTFQGGVRQLTAMQATSIFLQVVTGVANAHGLEGKTSIIHRDLKPGNILVFEGENGRPEFRVTDFGIAHKTRNLPSESSETEKPFGAGTPKYWSPQQRACEKPDKRDDVYSLGKIWYQLLANNLDKDIGTDLERRLNEIRPEIPKEIKVLVKQCVDEVRTDDMPKDAVELKDRLVKLQIEMRPPRDNLLNDLWIQRKWQVKILDDIAKMENRSEYSPSWREVIENDPDESVVTNHYFRERIIATRLPWRVRDKGTNIEMLLIPPGRFMMGASPDDSKAQPDEKPVHEVLISNAFYLGRTPVTQAQWRHSAKNPYKTPSHHGGVPSRPVENVSWDMIKDFNSATGFRLPTEAEWEYACRAGSSTPLYGVLNEIAWYKDNSDGQTHAVATKLPNALGLYDMIGNVWEWCEDFFGNYSTANMVNPTGPMSGEERLLRGGYVGSIHCSASRRLARSSYSHTAYNGFRAVRTP